MLLAYEEAVHVADVHEEDDPDPFEPVGAPAPPHATGRPRVPRPRIYDPYSPRAIVELLDWIESDTLPRTRDKLFWHALRELRFERAGKKIKAAIETAIAIHMDDVDVIELNEAFAAQALACLDGWSVDPADERVNPNGGAIALGHPLGCSGARLVLTLAHELRRRDASVGLASMCIGVG